MSDSQYLQTKTKKFNENVKEKQLTSVQMDQYGNLQINRLYQVKDANGTKVTVETQEQAKNPLVFLNNNKSQKSQHDYNQQYQFE